MTFSPGAWWTAKGSSAATWLRSMKEYEELMTRKAELPKT